MLALSCCHDKKTCVPSNSCMNNNVEETQIAMQQDVNLSSSKIIFSSSSTYHCLMAKFSSSNDNNNDNNDEEDDEENNDALLHDLPLLIYISFPKCPPFKFRFSSSLYDQCRMFLLILLHTCGPYYYLLCVRVAAEDFGV